jgi:hypothetical protein
MVKVIIFYDSHYHPTAHNNVISSKLWLTCTLSLPTFVEIQQSLSQYLFPVQFRADNIIMGSRMIVAIIKDDHFNH